MEIYTDCGYLEIIKGPMFSGKTTRLLELYKKYKFCGINTLVINYSKDNRYSDSMLSSHDKIMIPCLKAMKLADVWGGVTPARSASPSPPREGVTPAREASPTPASEASPTEGKGGGRANFPSVGGEGGVTPPYESAQVILINEGQFFPDIVEWVKHAVEIDHKTVYVCGLNSDYKRNKFGNWLDLETICDKVVMLNSFCSNCKKKPAIFSYRLSKETQVEVIGGAECYIPVCRKCYNIIS